MIVRTMSSPALADQGSPEAATDARRGLRVGPTAIGALLLFFYVRLGEGNNYGAHFGIPGGFLTIASSELRFWLTHLVLAVPGIGLLAYGFGHRLEPLAQRLVV